MAAFSSIKIRKFNAYTVFELSGEFGIHESNELKGEALTLISVGTCRMILDLSKVSLLSSIGLSAIIKLQEIITARGGDLRLLCSNEHICDVLAVTSTDRRIHVYKREEDLLKEISPSIKNP
jgi:anti-anti-sigma factor